MSSRRIIDPDTAVALYRAGWSLRRIAAHYGVSHIAVFHVLDRLDEPRRPNYRVASA